MPVPEKELLEALSSAKIPTSMITPVGPETSWMPAAIALLGGLFLFAASALLLYESRYNLKVINRHIGPISFLP